MDLSTFTIRLTFRGGCDQSFSKELAHQKSPIQLVPHFGHNEYYATDYSRTSQTSPSECVKFSLATPGEVWSPSRFQTCAPPIFILFVNCLTPTCNLVHLFPSDTSLHCSLSCLTTGQDTKIDHDHTVFSTSLALDLRRICVWGLTSHGCFNGSKHLFFLFEFSFSLIRLNRILTLFPLGPRNRFHYWFCPWILPLICLHLCY